MFLADPHQWSCKLKRNTNIDRWKTLLRHQGFSHIYTTSKLVQVPWVSFFPPSIFTEVSLEIPIFNRKWWVRPFIWCHEKASLKGIRGKCDINNIFYFSLLVNCGLQMDSSARMIWDLPEDDAYRLANLPSRLWRGILAANIGMGL